MKLSVIIPSYNEGRTIFKILQKVKKSKTLGLKKEIIIVDDGSTDGTETQISRFKSLHSDLKIKVIKHQQNRGKGSAIKSGIKKATGDILLIQDADLEYSPKYYPLLLKPILEKKAQIVYGTRLQKMKLVLFGRQKTPFISHYLANRFLSFLTNLLYNSNLTDMETGYKIMTKEVYKKLHLTSKGFEVEPEITAKILKMGYKIFEVPIITKPRGYQEGKKITWRDGFLAILTLCRFRFS